MTKHDSDLTRLAMKMAELESGGGPPVEVSSPRRALAAPSPTHTLTVTLFFADGDVFIDVDNMAGRVLIRDPDNALKSPGALHVMRRIVHELTADLVAVVDRTGLDQSTR